jgi:hypothetical protein
VEHVARRKSLMEDGEAGRKKALKSLLLRTVLFLDNVRHDAGNGLEARNAHLNRMRGTQGLGEHRLEVLQKRDDRLGADLQRERSQNIKPELLVPGVLLDAQLEDERKQLGPATCSMHIRPRAAVSGLEERGDGQVQVHERVGLARAPLEAAMAASLVMVSARALRTLSCASTMTPSSRPAFTTCCPCSPTAGHIDMSRLRRRSTAHICRICGSGMVRASSRSCGTKTGGFALCCAKNCSACCRTSLSGFRNCGITSARLAIPCARSLPKAHSHVSAAHGFRDAILWHE